MTVGIYEYANRVVEITMTPGDEVPGVCHRTMGLRLLSGPAFTLAEFAELKAAVFRVAARDGIELHSVTPFFE